MIDASVTCSLPQEEHLFRVYRRELEDGTPASPLWFCDGRKQVCRFDLDSLGMDGGTCYMASTAEGAFIEVFLRVAGKGLPRSEVDKRSLAWLVVEKDRTLVDLTLNATFGELNLDAKMWKETAEDYPRSRAFAAFAFKEGMEGVRWKSLRDQSGTRINYAVFSLENGLVSDAGIHVEKAEPIPEVVVRAVTREFRRPILEPSYLYPGR